MFNTYLYGKSHIKHIPTRRSQIEMSANGKQRQYEVNQVPSYFTLELYSNTLIRTALRQIIRKISLIHRKRTEIKLEPPKKANAEDSKSRPDWRSAKAELHPATALNGLQEAEQGDHDRPDTQSIHSARSTDSRCSNQSCQSTTSRRSISSFKSIKSCLSRLSTASRSSQFSYENPVLEAVETMLDLVAKEIETRSSKSTTHVLFGNRGKIPSRYISTLKELEVKLLDYTRHPMILSINVHTAPPGMLDLPCHIYTMV